MGMFIYKGKEPKPGYGYYSELDRKDIIDRLYPLLQSGWKIDLNGVIDTVVPGVAFHTPWSHQGHTPNAHCTLWHLIMFGHFGYFVPSKCQDCWKVVVGPRTLKELFQLKELQIELKKPSKCGIEMREYTPRLYGGYFYNWGFVNGKQCYDIVREAVNDKISPDVSVILKRACTEYEMEYPDSAAWEVLPDQIEMEQRIEDCVATTIGSSPQPQIVKDHVERVWMHWAFAAGDKTVLEFTGDKPLHHGPVTYHERTVEEIEGMLAFGRAKTRKYDMDKMKTLSEKLSKLSEKISADRDEFAVAMGLINPVYIGEHDEYT